MIQVLIVDDQQTKRELIAETVTRVLGSEGKYVCVDTIVAAYDQMRRTQFDLLILDLHLPRREGQEAEEGAGCSLLAQIREDGRVNKPRYVLGLSSFDELIEKYEEEFKKDWWHLIRYDLQSIDWEVSLERKLIYLLESESQAGSDFEADLAIVTALEIPELEAVMSLPANWEQDRSRKEDDSIYYRGCFERGGSCVKVVASTVGEMGMAMAAAHTAKVIHSYRPRYLAMAGITAGVSGGLGDVIVADHVWDYESGKQTQRGFEPAPVQISIDVGLKARLLCFSRQHDSVLRKIEQRWVDARPSTPLNAKIGAMASGASVVADRPVVDELLLRNRKLVAIEMEAFGVCCAARTAAKPRPGVLIVKSICDFADAKKDDAFQKYAAFTSANYLYEFALAFLHESQ